MFFRLCPRNLAWRADNSLQAQNPLAMPIQLPPTNTAPAGWVEAAVIELWQDGRFAATVTDFGIVGEYFATKIDVPWLHKPVISLTGIRPEPCAQRRLRMDGRVLARFGIDLAQCDLVSRK